MDEEKMEFIVSSLNIFQNNLKADPIIDPKTYEVNIVTKPREPRPTFKAPTVVTKSKRPRWALRTSIFKNWHAENEDFTAKCFETDWYFY